VRAAPSKSRGTPAPTLPFPGDLVLVPVSRRPTRLEESTVRTILDREVPAVSAPAAPVMASIVVVTCDNLTFLRLCLETVLAATDLPFEVIVVDNGSSDDTPSYLARLAERNSNVRVVLNDSNRGFAAGSNQGAEMGAGEVLVLLNDDTAVSPGWLGPLIAHLSRPEVGMVGPTTNRTGNEAQVDAEYRTLSGLVGFADARAERHAGEAFEIPTLTMFCVAMRRALYDEVGPLDERFAVGLLEDDDYSRRVKQAGYRLLCADDAFVHHFGETSFGKLVASGEYARVLETNRARFEDKWHVAWQPYERRHSERYRGIRDWTQRAVAETVPPGSTVLVVSRGDDELLRMDGRHAWHFPRADDGTRSPGSSTSARRGRGSSSFPARRCGGSTTTRSSESTSTWSTSEGSPTPRPV
jgi:GT2 family glycosyltransferase